MASSNERSEHKQTQSALRNFVPPDVDRHDYNRGLFCFLIALLCNGSLADFCCTINIALLVGESDANSVYASDSSNDAKRRISN